MSGWSVGAEKHGFFYLREVSMFFISQESLSYEIKNLREAVHSALRRYGAEAAALRCDSPARRTILAF